MKRFPGRWPQHNPKERWIQPPPPLSPNSGPFVLISLIDRQGKLPKMLDECCGEFFSSDDSCRTISEEVVQQFNGDQLQPAKSSWKPPDLVC